MKVANKLSIRIVSMEYLVSVRLMTYNHEPFIKKAMDGIMMQKVNFPVEVVVGDDFSVDNTLDIISSYTDTKNIHIRILDRKIGDDYWKSRQVKGRLFNFIDILENCSGRYIALLDGDDYWTDPLKLKKQVDFLQKNVDCSIVFHACKQVTGRKYKIIRYDGKPIIDLSEYLKVPPFATTGSLVLRKAVIKHYEQWMLNLFAGDFVFRYLSFLEGKMGYIDEVMCVYNKGVEGSWSKRNITKEVAFREYRDNLKMLRYMGEKRTKTDTLVTGMREREFILKRRLLVALAKANSFVGGLRILLSRIGIVGFKNIVYFILKR